eukprot:GHVQ01039937.1.p1 GENE.GHVQ01039937.1~~GHVQ01039937.1.p1  ORF type:complete len:1345 (-),score=122.95 GHVQ01039937.1:455-4489(-)
MAASTDGTPTWKTHNNIQIDALNDTSTDGTQTPQTESIASLTATHIQELLGGSHHYRTGRRGKHSQLCKGSVLKTDPDETGTDCVSFDDGTVAVLENQLADKLQVKLKQWSDTCSHKRCNGPCITGVDEPTGDLIVQCQCKPPAVLNPITGTCKTVMCEDLEERTDSEAVDETQCLSFYDGIHRNVCPLFRTERYGYCIPQIGMHFNRRMLSLNGTQLTDESDVIYCTDTVYSLDQTSGTYNKILPDALQQDGFHLGFVVKACNVFWLESFEDGDVSSIIPWDSIIAQGGGKIEGTTMVNGIPVETVGSPSGMSVPLVCVRLPSGSLPCHDMVTQEMSNIRDNVRKQCEAKIFGVDGCDLKTNAACYLKTRDLVSVNMPDYPQVNTELDPYFHECQCVYQNLYQLTGNLEHCNGHPCDGQDPCEHDCERLPDQKYKCLCHDNKILDGRHRCKKDPKEPNPAELEKRLKGRFNYTEGWRRSNPQICAENPDKEDCIPLDAATLRTINIHLPRNIREELDRRRDRCWYQWCNGGCVASATTVTCHCQEPAVLARSSVHSPGRCRQETCENWKSRAGWRKYENEGTCLTFRSGLEHTACWRYHQWLHGNCRLQKGLHFNHPTLAEDGSKLTDKDDIVYCADKVYLVSEPDAVDTTIARKDSNTPPNDGTRRKMYKAVSPDSLDQSKFHLGIVVKGCNEVWLEASPDPEEIQSPIPWDSVVLQEQSRQGRSNTGGGGEIPGSLCVIIPPKDHHCVDPKGRQEYMSDRYSWHCRFQKIPGKAPCKYNTEACFVGMLDDPNPKSNTDITATPTGDTHVDTMSRQCLCEYGDYQLTENLQNCGVVDPCTIDACEQGCINTPNLGYKCECYGNFDKRGLYRCKERPTLPPTLPPTTPPTTPHPNKLLLREMAANLYHYFEGRRATHPRICKGPVGADDKQLTTEDILRENCFAISEILEKGWFTLHELESLFGRLPACRERCSSAQCNGQCVCSENPDTQKFETHCKCPSSTEWDQKINACKINPRCEDLPTPAPPPTANPYSKETKCRSTYEGPVTVCPPYLEPDGEEMFCRPIIGMHVNSKAPDTIRAQAIDVGTPSLTFCDHIVYDNYLNILGNETFTTVEPCAVNAEMQKELEFGMRFANCDEFWFAVRDWRWEHFNAPFPDSIARWVPIPWENIVSQSAQLGHPMDETQDPSLPRSMFEHICATLPKEDIPCFAFVVYCVRRYRRGRFPFRREFVPMVFLPTPPRGVEDPPSYEHYVNYNIPVHEGLPQRDRRQAQWMDDRRQNAIEPQVQPLVEQPTEDRDAERDRLEEIWRAQHRLQFPGLVAALAPRSLGLLRLLRCVEVRDAA